jgi:hypothetical protein
METASSSETLINICQVIWRHIPEDINLPYDRFESNETLSSIRGAEYFDLMRD